MYTNFSQRDPRWANKTLGQSRLTIGRYGCVVTGIATLSSLFGNEVTPEYVADHVRFTSDGLVIWQSLNIPGMRFDRREYGRHDLRIKSALSSPNDGVILQVAHGSHWVVALAQFPEMPKYLIADPWFGDEATSQRYENSVTGAAYFSRS